MLGNTFARHNLSTWLIFVSIIGSAATIHPSMLAYLILVINAAFLFLIREIARSEGKIVGMNWWHVGVAVIVMLVALVFASKVNWLAI